MSKNLFQDMVKNKVIKNDKNIKIFNVETSLKNKKNVDKKINFDSYKDDKKNIHPYGLWFVAIICVLSLFFTISYFFSSAIITINPRIANLELNQNISANKDGTNGILPFNLMITSGEENQIVDVTETKEVSQKAEGVVIFYNMFSSVTQKLNINTRLEGSNGKIYMTENSVVIPGMSKNNIPGSVKVKIYATLAGPIYNSDPLDFKILGFKGTSKYEKIYARSDGSIKGGFIGKLPIISDTKKISLVDDMKISLEKKLIKKAEDQIPSDFILFRNGVFLDTDISTVEMSSPENNKLNLKLKGTLYGFLFNVNKITKNIVTANLPNYDNSDVFIPNLKDLDFVLSNKDNSSWSDVKNINFVLSGKTQIVWKIDSDNLVKNLLGIAKKDFNKILLNYPNINSADLILKPIWRMSLPEKEDQIKIIVNYPK